MSDAGDNDTEMFRRHRIDDAAAEAFVTGNGADEELVPLAAFADELRAMAAGPPPAASLQLAAMLAEGFSTDKGDLLVTAASSVPGPAVQVAGLPKWRTRRMIITEFIAGLSVATKAAFGIGMAAASVTAAGAAGALPAPAQHAVSAAVEAATPFSFPDKANDNADFGGTVSTDAHDGGVDGKDVSEDAKHNGDAHRADGAGTPAGAGQPTDPGQNGLDQANTTPAAGHVPTSVPAGQPAAAGAQGSTGLDTANGTPAAGHTPESVPVGAPADTPPADAGSQSSTGLGTASTTPAAGHLPTSVPAGRP